MQNQRLSLTSVGLLLTSLFLIFGSRIVVSHFGLTAVLSFSGWTPETLGVFTASLSVIGYALMAVGAGLFAKVLYSALKCRFQFDSQLVKSQARKIRMAVIALACLVVVTSMFATTPVIQADAVKTTGYYLVTPANEWDYLLGNYTNGNIFAIRGSDWANLMTYPTPAPWASYTSNSTAVWQQVLSTISYGTVYAKEVAFPLTLQSSIPANVQVICNYRGTTYTYINSASSLGSPYTVSVGQGINNGYYLATDSGNRIAWSSTDVATLLNQVTQNNTVIQIGKISAELTASWDIFGKSGITIQGLGSNQSVLYTSMDDMSINASYVTDLTIQGLTLIGSADNTKTLQRGIQLYTSSNNVLIQENTIINMGYDGIDVLNGGNNTKILNNNIINCKDDGINPGGDYSGTGTKNTLIQGNFINGCTNDGIHISDSSSFTTASNNIIINCGADGVAFYNSSNNIVSNNIITSCGYGIRSITGVCANETIIGNVISYTTVGDGIFLGHSSSFSVITSNKILSSNAYGIDIGASSYYIEVTSNIIQGGTRGIYSVGTRYLTISCNSIESTGAYGIVLSGTATQGASIVSENMIKGGCTTAAIYIDSANNTITNNQISATTGTYGIQEKSGGTNDYNVLVGNMVFSGTTPIVTVGTNTKCNLCYNGTIWVP